MAVSGPWFCDSCGHPIEKPEDGMVQWLHHYVDGRPSGRDLRIVHHLTKSPIGGARGCYPDERAENRKDGSSLSDWHLYHTLGPDGLVRLLSLLEEGEFPAPEVNRVIMRLFVPGYEQARRYADRAIAGGVLEPEYAGRILLPKPDTSDQRQHTAVGELDRRRTIRCSRPGQSLRLSYAPRGRPRRLSFVFGKEHR